MRLQMVQMRIIGPPTARRCSKSTTMSHVDRVVRNASCKIRPMYSANGRGDWRRLLTVRSTGVRPLGQVVRAST